jgi:riboflavin kinase/FMN adenylyltransferase
MTALTDTPRATRELGLSALRRQSHPAGAARAPHAPANPLSALFAAHKAPCVVTAGTFDGVHCGHRALVARAAREARARGLKLMAVTFSPRPDAVRQPPGLPDLCSLRERVARLRRAGADDVVVVPFSRALMGMSAAEFVGHLADDLGMRALCVGEDFALGRAREGDVGALRALGVDVITVPLVHELERGEKISSSTLRARLAHAAAAPAPGLAASDDAAPAHVARPHLSAVPHAA